jgi:hypothetical protein
MGHRADDAGFGVLKALLLARISGASARRVPDSSSES